MKVVSAKLVPIKVYGPHERTGGYWAAAISAAGTIGSSLINSNASKHAANAAGNAQYQPIDLNALQAQAQQFARDNAAQSIAIEAQNEPSLSAARFGLQGTVASELAQGGNLSPDVYNQAARGAITGASSSGIMGAAGPITAASLGLTSQGLLQQRILNAQNLLNTNPLPAGGIDPGSLASAAIGQNSAINQFDISKLGAQTAANQSTANTYASALGGLGGITSAYLNNRGPSAATNSLNNQAGGNSVAAGYGGVSGGLGSQTTFGNFSSDPNYFGNTSLSYSPTGSTNSGTTFGTLM